MRCTFAILLNTGLTLGLMGLGAPIWVGVITAFPAAWLAAYRPKPRPTEVTSKGFVAWYIQPYGRHHEYIREYPAGNIAQEYYSAGRESVSSISQATVYPTEEAARAVLPVYDGSADIGGRTGVTAV